MDNEVSDGLIRVIIGGVATISGIIFGNFLNFRTNSKKQVTNDFDVITDKWEKLYDNLEKHNVALELRVTELEDQVSKLVDINNKQLREIHKLRKEQDGKRA